MSYRTALLVIFGVGAAITCGRDDGPFWDGDREVDPFCRDRPTECEGDIGGFCRVDTDCDAGECCSNDDCGGGMCTYRCSGNIDCPSPMLCEGGYCFFACGNNPECAPGQSCKHGNSVCQY